MDSHTLLLIDDEANMRHMLAALLTKSNYRVETAENGKEGLEKVTRDHFDFILCDIRMPIMDGITFLESAIPLTPDTPIIMMSAYGTLDSAVEAMKKGAYDYISKPFKTDEILLVLQKAQERERLREENETLKKQIHQIADQARFGNMVAQSKAMQSIFKLSQKVSSYKTTVLITGESGTGKELIARGIHFAGDRAKHPFIPVNCGGIPENLIESELFGYMKGAFTGAERNKKGLFEEAHKGTIFLDEIGELPLPLQVRLLRVLQENEIRPIGDGKPRKIDVRVVAATARNLETEIQEGRFRQDLFFRLNVIHIHIPPLRERTSDIPLLVRHFIGKLNTTLNRSVEGIAPPAMARLLKHRWPGNVRELENMIERAMVLTDNALITLESLPPEIQIGENAGERNPSNLLNYNGFSLKEARRIMEKQMIENALKKTDGNRTQAAKILEISHPSLLSKMKEYNVLL